MVVSDWIAVMKDGDIQQVGTPKVLYLRPANLFVSTFIGHTNLVHCSLGVNKGKAVLQLPDNYYI